MDISVLKQCSVRHKETSNVIRGQEDLINSIKEFGHSNLVKELQHDYYKLQYVMLENNINYHL